jgi:hypothetical protein
MSMIDRLVTVRLLTVLGLAALALVLAFGVSAYTTTAKEAPAFSGIDILALTNSAGDLPQQHFPTH